MHNYDLKLTSNNDYRTLDKKRIEEIRKKLRSHQYIRKATEKIASDLTHLLFR